MALVPKISPISAFRKFKSWNKANQNTSQQVPTQPSTSNINIQVNGSGAGKSGGNEKESFLKKLVKPKTGEESKNTFWDIILLPFKPFVYVIKNFGFPLLAIGIVILAVIFFIRATNEGFLQSATKEGLVGIERTGAPILVKSVFWRNLYMAWKNPSSLRDPYSLDTVTVKPDANYGVKILSFGNVVERFVSQNGEPIDIALFANIDATSLPDEGDLEIIFNCFINEAGNKITNGITKPSTKVIPQGADSETFSVECSFPSYAKFDKKENTKRVEFVARHRFASQARFRSYFMDEEDYRDLLDKGISDPFSYNKINDPLLDGRVIKSEASSGPLEVAVGTPSKLQTQPFIESESNIYFIMVSLVNTNILSLGNLRKINDITLNVPHAVKLNTEVGDCAFEDTGEQVTVGGGKFDVYKLKESKLAIANKNCDSLDTIEVKDCIDDKEKLGFSCGFKVTDISSNADIFLSEFTTRVDYEYEAREFRAITIRKDETTVTGCNLLAENECVIKQECIASFEEGRFISCGYCSSLYRVCGDYANEVNCNKDPCDLGNCVYQNGFCASI